MKRHAAGKKTSCEACRMGNSLLERGKGFELRTVGSSRVHSAPETFIMKILGNVFSGILRPMEL